MKRRSRGLVCGLATAVLVAAAAQTFAQSPQRAGQAACPSPERLAQALDAKRAGDRERALALVEQVLAATADSVSALWLRAWLHTEGGHKAQAAADFARIVALQPGGELARQAQAALRRLPPPPPPPGPRVAPRAPARPEPQPVKPPVTPVVPEPVKPPATPAVPKPPAKPEPEPAKPPVTPVVPKPPAKPAPEPVKPPVTPAVPKPPVVSEPAAAAANFGALYRQAEIAMRMRRYGEAVPLLARVVQEAPDHGGAAACGRLARACLLAQCSQQALDVLEPVRAVWDDDGYARHQYALCRYAVAHAAGLDRTRVPDVVASAFACPEKEYPADAPQIQKVARRIFAGRSSDRERARAAFDYVLGHTCYDKSLIPLGRQSVLVTLSSGRAVCTGFAQLYITLCRAGRVPARLVSGSGDVGFHNWTEVWLVGKGWITVDPSRASTRGHNTFGRLDGDLRAYPNQRENW